MKILIQKKLSKELEATSNKDLKNKTIRYIEKFDSYFTSPTKFESSKIEKLQYVGKGNLFVFRIDNKYRLIFTAVNDNEGELNVILLEMAKHDIYERTVFKHINE
jgi:hypothetical protein